ncbi:hypothetical protein R3P38DRAFT_2603816 [Favolaschia claudopus]|uniref:Zn(2)-C6 fungal-type domain-containing protein n=1 Tax=Favolaschia claudopus TaxID=2862362 RepID=A0AAW0DIG3_9AGAR
MTTTTKDPLSLPIDAKLKTPTCSRCKIRKIRCDGSEPCSSCKSHGLVCEYDANAKESRFGVELRKGQACLQCRRKKKRCDGQLPCRTCSSGRKKIVCEYPDGITVTLPQLPKWGKVVGHNDDSSDSSSPGPSRSSDIHNTARSDNSKNSTQSLTHILNEPAAMEGIESSRTESLSSFPEPPAKPPTYSPHTSPEIPFTPGSDTSSATLVASGSLTHSPPHPLVESTSPTDADDVPIEVEVDPSDTFSIPDNYATLTELSQARASFLENVEKRNLVPPEVSVNMPQQTSSSDRLHANPHTPYYQVALPTQRPETESEELSTMRRLFVLHRTQLGFSVSEPTLVSIVDGSTDESMLHPAVLHASQLLGYMLARQLEKTALCLPGARAREDEQMRLTYDAIHHYELCLTPYPVACLQAINLLAIYFLSLGNVGRAREFIIMGNGLIRAHHLDAFPNIEASRNTFTPQPVSDLAETQAAVVQLVYSDLFHIITLKLPSLIDGFLEDNFKKLIDRPNIYADGNYFRAKSAFLMYQTQRLTTQWSQRSGLSDSEVDGWQCSYWNVMEALDSHRSFITLTLTRLAFCPAMSTLALNLKVCSILVLTGTAALLSLFSADHVELRQKKYSAVLEITSISSIFTEQDCEHLDPVISTCWTAIILTLDQCTKLGDQVMCSTLHDFPAMAGLIRQKNDTVQRLIHPQVV